MSFVALVTNRFDEVTRFYGELLGFPIIDQWDRSNARGQRFDAGGMRLEIIDNEREEHECELAASSNKFHIVGEVDDIVSMIAEAVEQQSASTQEIAKNISRVSQGVYDVSRTVTESSVVADQIANEIAAVNQSAGEMSNSSSQVSLRAKELSGLAQKLIQMMSKFKT